MNPIIFSSLFYGLAVLASAVSGQDQGACGCAPQPTIIQLSCNGGSGIRPPPPNHRPPPPPPPAQATTSAYNPTTAAQAPVPRLDPEMCEMDPYGYPLNTPEGGWPPGYHLSRACAGPNIACGPAEVKTDPSFTIRPPKNWDGKSNTLGFDLIPGTPEYNMMMCWPIRQPDGNDYSWNFGNNMFPTYSSG